MTEKMPDDLVGQVIDSKAPSFSKLPKRGFLAWHKPRKQWIRLFQWKTEVASLCDRIQFRDGRPLRYLSLPGEDLLDIRVVRDLCQERNISLRYLGVNEESASDNAETWLHLAWNDLNNKGNVVRDSIVTKDKFEHFARKDSQLSRYLDKYGSFDVVNLDLCDSLSPKAVRTPNYYEALQRIAESQVDSRSGREPWLLFITSRSGTPNVSDSDMQRLTKCVAENASTYSDFADALTKLVPPAVSLKGGTMPKFDTLKPQEFSDLFCVGIGKWLIKLLASAEPKWRASLRASYSYRVTTSDRDMISLAFLLEPHIKPPKDRSGLASIESATTAPNYDERKLANDLLKSVRDIGDLDRKLHYDVALLGRMEKSTEDLLQAAHYPIADLRQKFGEWRRQQEGWLRQARRR